VPNDAAIIKLAQNIYEKLNKRPKQQITKDDLMAYADQALFQRGATKIDDIFELIVKSTSASASEAAGGTASEVTA
jgi:hypothetical protein